MILNPWDVQSKRIHTTDGVMSALYAGEYTYGGGEGYTLCKMSETVGTLCARGYPDKLTHQDVTNGLYPVVKRGGEEGMKVVRRLTPMECERLQGYPDGWTDIGDWVDSKGKTHKASDSPRYKALGNSIAVGFANRGSGFWMNLMKRISAQYEREATLGSLFDGISGFPLAWARFNGAKNCRWSSEIEEFPIAVCKKHFGDEETGLEGDINKYL